MITYPKFIKKLERLVADAKKLRNASEMHKDKMFRNWRLELEAALKQITQLDYLLPTRIRLNSRSFGYSPDNERHIVLFKSYQMEMEDTINELSVIINSYKEHGEPPKGGKSKEIMKHEQKWPTKMTLSWLFHNAPISLWAWFAGLLIAAFTLGIKVADTKYYKEFKAEPKIEKKK